MILCDNIVFELQAVGGISRYWAKNIERLDRTALDLSFCEGSRGQENVFRRGLRLSHPVIVETGSVTFRRFRAPRVRADVFHSSYYRISRNARFNVVTIHDFMNELFPSTFRDPLLAMIKRRACRNADRILVVSKRTRQDLLRHYPDVDPGVVEVLYNGVDDEFFPEPRSAPVDANGEALQPGTYLLYVGTRGHCKNFTFVLQFLAQARAQGLTDRLVIVGGGPLSKAELTRAGELRLPPEVFLQLPRVDNPTLRQLYSNATALLIPSLYEGFGLPALEAARCGALVLASRGSALDEIVGETEYSFDLDREGEIARVLTLGFTTAAARAERDRVTRRSDLFSWDRSANRLAQIYDDLNRS
jgi:mannosyltransferase